MASATVPSFLESSQDKTNGVKLIRLIVDGGTEALRNIFLCGKHPGNLEGILNSYQVQLSNLKRKVITQPQWEKLYPASPNKPNIKEFDITLLCILLRNICGLSAPSTGWNTMPPQSDNSPEANIVRIKCFRNELYAHVSDIGVSATQFESYWKEISSALVGLGINQGEIDRLKGEQCGKEEVDRVMKEWSEMEVEVKVELKKVLSQIRSNQTVTSRPDKVLDKLIKCDFKVEVEGYCERFLDGTRQWIFEKVKNWFDDPISEHRALVISGVAGVGKSVVSAVICREWKKSEQLAGCHFCQHSNARYSKPQIMLQSLACHVSDVVPQYKKALVKNLSQNVGQEFNCMGIVELFSLLFKEPFSKVIDPGKNLLVVIDGVDETEYEGRSECVHVIARYFHKLPSWIRFVVTTRPERNIADELTRLKPLYLDTNDEENLKDIRLFFDKKLPCAIEEKNKDAIISGLADRSEGLMLYAFFLTELVNENLCALDISSLDSLPVGISGVYKSYFQRLEDELRKNSKIGEEKFLHFLCAITVSRQPLPLKFVSRILNPDESSLSAKRSVMKAISCISSLFPICGDKLNFFHKSVKDWLVNHSDDDFIIDEKVGHEMLAKLCAEEFDEVERRGITGSQLELSDSLKYALQHGIQHMLKVNEECESVEILVRKYSINLELIYGRLCVDSGASVSEMLLLQEHQAYCMLSDITRESVGTLLFLLKKYSHMLNGYPHSFFQHVLNEGGKELSTKASNLLNTRYPDIPYLELENKMELHQLFEARYYPSDKIVSFDVSPNQDYMVCRCWNGAMELFSLKTGKKEWAQENCYIPVIPTSLPSVHRCSVVFHPRENVILPGCLDMVYTITGLCQPGPFSCERKYTFSACSFSQDKTRMVIKCLDNGALAIVWNLENGQKIKCIDCSYDIVSFACSSKGDLVAITDVRKRFSVYDVERDYGIKHTTEFKQLRKLKIISGCNSDSWFCFGVMEDLSESFFKFESRRLMFMKTKLRVEGMLWPCGSNAIAEFELMMLESEQCWHQEVRRILRLQCRRLGSLSGYFSKLDGKRAVIASPDLDYISVLNVNQLKETYNYTPEKDEGYIETAISLDGSIVYQIDPDVKTYFSFWKRVSVARRRKNVLWNVTVNSYVSSLVPVKDGVVFLTKKQMVELWNTNVSKRRKCFHQLTETTHLVPISEDLVGCEGQCKFDILDINSKKVVSTTVLLKDCKVLAANCKSQVLISNSCGSKLSLWQSNTKIWERPLKPWQCSASFSPEGDKFVLWYWLPVLVQYIVEASTGNSLLEKHYDVYDCRFLNDSEFFICSCKNNFLYLFNVCSGDLLTYLDVGSIPYSLSTCLKKSLFAVGLRSKDYKLIKVHLPSEHEDNSSKPGPSV